MGMGQIPPTGLIQIGGNLPFKATEQEEWQLQQLAYH